MGSEEQLERLAVITTQLMNIARELQSMDINIDRPLGEIGDSLMETAEDLEEALAEIQ